MAKATKKSKVHPIPDDEPSNAQPQRVKTCHQLPTTTDDKKNHWSNSKSSKKVQKTTKKSKKTLPRIMKGKMPEQITPPPKMTKKNKGKELFGHRHHLMDKMSTGTGTEPENSSSESSSPSTSDQESQ